MAKKTTFTLAANIAGNANAGILVGDFNNWDESNGIQLKKQKDGSLTADVALEPGTYHYRYFLEDGRWENDGNAEHYSHVPGLHVDNCVITVKEEKAAPKAKAPVEEEKAEAPKKAAPKKAAAPKKEEAPKAEAKPKAAPKAKAEPKEAKAEPKAAAKPKATKTKK